MLSRSPHFDVFSGHAVALAVEQACTPLLHGERQAIAEPGERRQVVRALNGLVEVLGEMVGEELRD